MRRATSPSPTRSQPDRRPLHHRHLRLARGGVIPACRVAPDLSGDRSLVAGRAATYTVTFAADPGSLDTNCYLVADLDVYNDVRQTTKADNVSAPLSGVFQTGDGNVYAFTPVAEPASATRWIVSQDPTTGTSPWRSTAVDYMLQLRSGVTIATPTGDNTIDARATGRERAAYRSTAAPAATRSPAATAATRSTAAPREATRSSGGGGGNTIYGGAGGGDTIYAGSGGDTIYCGAAAAARSTAAMAATPSTPRPTAATRSAAAMATTRSTAAAREAIRSTTATATTRSTPATAATRSPSATATTRSSAAPATTRSPSERERLGPGRDGNDNINVLPDGNGTDWLYASTGPGSNTINGGTGTNNIYGDGHSTIYGNGLHDILDGVPSSDTIYCHGSGLSCDDIQGFGDGGSETGVVAEDHKATYDDY